MKNNIVPLLIAVILTTPSVTAFAQQWHQQQWHQDPGGATQDHGHPGDQRDRADQEGVHGGQQDQGWHGSQQADSRDGGPIPKATIQAEGHAT